MTEAKDFFTIEDVKYEKMCRLAHFFVARIVIK